MRFESTVGTANHRTVKVHSKPNDAKKWLRGHVASQREWAARYNNAVDNDLANISNEINDLNLSTLNVGDTRSWGTTDEHTGFKFVFTIQKIEE